MKHSTRLLLNFLVIISALTVFIQLINKPLNASQLTPVNAIVKMSVCGNDEIEGGEDCENDDLNGKTCTSWGYAEGSLFCDIACTYDTASCSGVLITTTPIPTPLPSSDVTSSNSASTGVVSIIQTLTNLVNNVLTQIKLSAPLLIYDADSDGQITLNEMASAVQNWANYFYGVINSQFEVNAASAQEVLDEVNKCDIDSDGDCDIVDFSVLLYFVER